MMPIVKQFEQAVVTIPKVKWHFEGESFFIEGINGCAIRLEEPGEKKQTAAGSQYLFLFFSSKTFGNLLN